MTANHSTVATVLVAIDISKHCHEVLTGIPGKKRHRRLTVTNTLDDCQRLSVALASSDLPVRIGFYLGDRQPTHLFQQQTGILLLRRKIDRLPVTCRRQHQRPAKAVCGNNFEVI